MALSHDSIVMILLCSHIGLGSNPDPAPMTLRDWNPLAKNIQSKGIRPADLLGLTVFDLQSQLELGTDLPNGFSN